MGLTKAKTSPDAQSGDYWHIRSVSINKYDGTAGLELALYKDRATRDAAAPNNEPQETFQMEVSAADYDAVLGTTAQNVVNQNPFTELYPHVKTNALAQIGFDLSDATDDA